MFVLLYTSLIVPSISSLYQFFTSFLRRLHTIRQVIFWQENNYKHENVEIFFKQQKRVKFIYERKYGLNRKKFFLVYVLNPGCSGLRLWSFPIVKVQKLLYL